MLTVKKEAHKMLKQEGRVVFMLLFLFVRSAFFLPKVQVLKYTTKVWIGVFLTC